MDDEDTLDTQIGRLPRRECTFEDRVSEHENSMNTHRLWFYRGVLVREDVWVSIKRGFATAPINGGFRG